MQVKIELINNFYSYKPEVKASYTTRDLPIEEAGKIYNVLRKLLDRLEEKGREFWNKKEPAPERLFSISKDEIIKQETPATKDDNDLLEWGEDWIVPF